VSSKFHTLNPLHWATSVQQSYEDISKAPENESDIYLVHLVELQHIAENVKHISIQQLPSQSRPWNCSAGLNLKLLTSELQKFKASLPESLQQDCEYRPNVIET
jgi:hypothetical protein